MTRKTRRRMPVTAVCAVLALSLSACATPLPPRVAPLFVSNRAPAPIHDSPDVCEPDAPAGGVPDGFDAVAAYLCDPVLTIAPIDPHATPPPLEFGPGTHTVPGESAAAPEKTAPEAASPEPAPPITPRRFEGDLAPLLAALRMPDAPPTDGACALVMVYPPDVRLVDARGRWVRPAIPRNACHQPVREPIDAAFERLTEVR